MLGAASLHCPNMDPRSAEYSSLNHQVHIKQEAHDHGLPSPSSPISPHPSRPRSAVPSLDGRKHYSLSHRGVKNPGDTMSSSSYSPWGSSARRPIQGENESAEDEAFGMPPQYMNDPYLSMPGPSSSSLSSWNTPSHMQTNMSITMNCNVYPGVAGHGGVNMAFPGMGGSGNVDMPPTSAFNSIQGQDPQAMTYSGQHHGMTPYPVLPPPSSSSNKDDEIYRLHRRIQELERELSQFKRTNSPHYATFQSSWRVRTESRKRIYCSLNRAGNALCAWHDSRRERRAFPPRNAPPGYLNCGCTYEEALFEESLSRHGVGSYLPGDNVRMDPALRNPLLQLLERRYGYKDGDFEHDPASLTWAEGESPTVWEKKAQSGAVVKRRTDSGH